MTLSMIPNDFDVELIFEDPGFHAVATMQRTGTASRSAHRLRSHSGPRSCRKGEADDRYRACYWHNGSGCRMAVRRPKLSIAARDVRERWRAISTKEDYFFQAGQG
jgi:hypothetical protein